MKFNQWLEQQYLAWEMQSGQRKTLLQFAEFIGISNSVLSHYLSGSRKPSPPILEKIAEKLGDEAYDVLERPRPDPLLRKIIQNWGQMTEEQKDQIKDLLGNDSNK